MLNSFIRDSAFFQSLRDRRMTIAHKDLDTNFNNLTNYINKKINPLIDTLTNKKAAGIQDNPDKFLKNIGDGSTKFTRISSSDIPNYALSLAKFRNIAAGSIIASNDDSSLRQVTPLLTNQILSSITNNVPTWKKATGNHFANNSIPADKVGLAVFGAEHLTPGILGGALADQSVETRHIIDSTLTANKITQGSFTIQKISDALINSRAQSLDFIDGAIQARHIVDNSFNFQDYINYFQGGNRIFDKSCIIPRSVILPAGGDIDTNLFSTYKVMLISQFQIKKFFIVNKQDCVRSIHLADQSFTPKFKLNYNNWGQINKLKLSDELYARLRQGGLQ